MKELKKKKSIKIKLIKQVIFVKDLFKPYYQKKSDILMNSLRQRDAVLTSAKETNMQNENYFVYYKLDHIFKECSHRVIKVNALHDDADKFNHFGFNSNFDLKN